MSCSLRTTLAFLPQILFSEVYMGQGTERVERSAPCCLSGNEKLAQTTEV